MATIAFGPWLPDIAPLGNPGVLRAVNVLPAASGYRPMPAFTAATDALDARPLGAIQAENATQVVFQYAGDASKLYSNVSGSWTDVSKDGGYSTGAEERWEFIPWRNTVLATNFTDPPQQITFGDAAFADLTEDFTARHLAVVRDFVIAANTNDGDDGAVPSRVRNSAFNDAADWTVDPATGANYQDLKNAAVQRVFGGEYGVIFQRASIWRMSFAGGVVPFQYDETAPGFGLIAPGAGAQSGDTIDFLSDKGFFALRHGVEVTPTGAEKINDYVLNDLDKAALHRISAVADPRGMRVYWAYPGAGNTGGQPNRIVVYDRVLQRWSLISDTAELLWSAGGTSITVDSLAGIPVDALNIAIDASRWIGGAPDIGAFNGAYASGFFDGAPMTAVLETGERALASGTDARLKAFRALIDGGTVRARIGTRNSQEDGGIAWSPTLSPRTGRKFTRKSRARYHRFELTLSGAWKAALGVEIDPDDIRAGARRG